MLVILHERLQRFNGLPESCPHPEVVDPNIPQALILIGFKITTPLRRRRIHQLMPEAITMGKDLPGRQEGPRGTLHQLLAAIARRHGRIGHHQRQ